MNTGHEDLSLEDLDAILEVLGRTWLPPAAKPGFDKLDRQRTRLKHGERTDRAGTGPRDGDGGEPELVSAGKSAASRSSRESAIPPATA